MTEIKCPTCGSENIEQVENEGGKLCTDCICLWNESKRQPVNNISPMGNKVDCLNRIEQARDLINELHSMGLSYSSYNTLRDAVDCAQNYIEDCPAWIACKERLPEAGVLVAFFVNCGPDRQIVTTGVYNDWSAQDLPNEWESPFDYYNPKAVTHWQPLPQPPVAGKDGE